MISITFFKYKIMFKSKNKLKELFKRSQEEKFAIGQFNFSTFCQLEGVSFAVKELKKSVICGTSEKEARFIGMQTAVFLKKRLKEECGVDLFLNFDHGKSFESIKEAIDAGYDMVHFDGSDLSFEENIRLSKKVVDYAHKRNVLVEGEIAKIGGLSKVSQEKIEDVTLTSIDKIVKFIRETGVDCIALDVGNVHGIHEKMPELKLERITELKKETNCFIALHGGSGLAGNKIREAVANGVNKININTELRVAWRDAIYKKLSEDADETTPYKILPLAQEAVCIKTIEKIKLFNS